MLLVLNEWVFHDLLNDNGQADFQATANFLIAFARSNDQLVVPAEQRWKSKMYQLMRMSDPRQRQVSQLLQRLIRDPSRALLVTAEDVSAPPRSSYDWVPSEDVYLVVTYDVAGADVLVTTDEPLARAIDEHNGIHYQMRDDFLQSYSSHRS